MSPESHNRAAARAAVASTAVLVLDDGGRILASTVEAARVLGAPAEALRGTGIADLLTDPRTWAVVTADGPRSVRTVLKTVGDGEHLPVRLDLLPVEGPGLGFLVRLLPAGIADRLEEDQALLRAMFTQSGLGLVIHDSELRLTRMNPPAREAVADPGADTAVRMRGVRLDTLLVPEDAAPLQACLRQVAETGVPLIDAVMPARLAQTPERERTVKVTAIRMEADDGTLRGVVVTFTEVTEQERARRRAALVASASSRLGRSLDLGRNAQELADILVPGFADFAAVDLTEAALVGNEPGVFVAGAPMRRLAVACAEGEWPSELHPPGATIRVRDAESDYLRRGSVIVASDLADLRRRLSGDEERSRLVLASRAESLMVVPLHARGHVLGAVVLWRVAGRAPYTTEDTALAEDIGSRAALALDNARRFTRERRTAELLQRSLLPRPVLEATGAQTVGKYLPGSAAEGTAGSWFDVITLPSARLAFVVGTVTGHGLNAAAAMGRLRTAVRTLADLDPAPDELLTHLDDLVVRLEDDQKPDDVDGAVRGATCLYAVYDPVAGTCLMASAGHPAPVLAPAGGGAGVVRLTPGPALGMGGTPFDPFEVSAESGDVMAFGAGSLTEREEGGSELLLERVRDRVTPEHRESRSLTELADDVLAPLLADPPDDDAALLMVRLRAVPATSIATWEFPADPAVVAECRTVVTDQLNRWDLGHLAFTTELIVSELVTNAVRYAGGPVGLRLIKDQRLVCEVSDPSQSHPHLRRAKLTDEGGRGLYLIAQVTHRWGSRYIASGKTIWTEQLLEGLDID